jgi:hypothetical protein
MASRGGDIGSLLILSATGDGDRGALGGRWDPELGTVKWDKDLQTGNRTHYNTRHEIDCKMFARS